MRYKPTHKVDGKRDDMDQSYAHRHLRHVSYWLALIGSATVMVGVLTFTIYHAWTSTKTKEIIEQHFAAVIGLPAGALASLAIVVLLQGTSGPIKFSGFGFSIEGAAGPILFWVICFCAIAVAIKLLW